MGSIMRHMGKMDLALGPGLVGVAVDAGVGFGASYGIGYVYQSYSKTSWAAKNVNKLTAAVGKGLAVISAVMGGPQLLTGILNSAGQAGVGAIGLEMGLKAARKKMGKRAVLIDAAGALPAGATDTIGALGRARHGAAPSWGEVAEMAGAI